MNILSRLNRLIHKKQSMFVLVDILETTKFITMQFYIHNEDEVFFKTVSKRSIENAVGKKAVLFSNILCTELTEEWWAIRKAKVKRGSTLKPSRIVENFFKNNE